MAKKVPEHVAFRLAQKAKEAEKKMKEAEKKVKAAEKKAKEAEKKAKDAEKKVKATEKEEDDHDDHDDFDDFDDLDDLDDFDDETESPDEPEEETTSEDSSEGSDDQLDALLKQASSSEGSDQRIQRANRLAADGDFEGALEIWKDLIANEAENPENWRGLSSVLDQRNQPGDAAKAQTARDHADRIQTQAIAEKTGRKMEDIIADLMDDGVLNFSSGSDAKDSE